MASYIFNFQGIVVGPLCYFRDYIDFITGHNIVKHLYEVEGTTADSANNNHEEKSHRLKDIKQPSIVVSLFIK